MVSMAFEPNERTTPFSPDPEVTLDRVCSYIEISECGDGLFCGSVVDWLVGTWMSCHQ